MVIKKPYAFLIKYFKLIHVILGVLMTYITFKTTGLVNFFRDYVNHGELPRVNNLASSYINFFMYGAVILILGISITIYILMRMKEKKTKFYAFTIGYFLFYFIILTVTLGILDNIETSLISGEAARVYRDISLIIYVPQFYFLIYAFLRGIGFDVKKFNFNQDLEALKIEEKDAEEIEIDVPKNTYKIQRFIRRFIREFKYYVKENTFIFICLCTLLVAFIGTTIFMNIKIYNEKVNEGKGFTYKTFTLTNLDSMITNIDHNGNVFPNDKYYIVVTFNVKSRTARELDMKDFRLLVGKEVHYPTFSKRDYFIDYGNSYVGEKLKSGADKDYILTFEINKNLLRSNYTLRIVNNITYKMGEITPSYKDVTLKPILVDKVKEDKKIYKTYDELNFSQTNLKGSTLSVNDYKVTNNYYYDYEYCYMDDCKEMKGGVSVDPTQAARKTLLILDYDLLLGDSYFKNNIKDDRYFFFNFIKVRYMLDGKEKIATIDNRTPNSFTNTVVIQTENDLQKATKIDLVVTIRNYQYIINLK